MDQELRDALKEIMDRLDGIDRRLDRIEKKADYTAQQLLAPSERHNFAALVEKLGVDGRSSRKP